MRFEIWGMSGVLATEHEEHLPFAEERLWHWLGALDVACNRFRPDSELSRLNECGEAHVSSTFERALRAAIDSYEATDGLCDPTVLPSLIALGYGVDFAELARTGATSASPLRPSPGAGAIYLEKESHVKLGSACQLDLGASAKALAADAVADDVGALGGVIVEIGGDVAVRGHGPTGPWSIGVSDCLEINGNEPRVSLAKGGLATSSTLARSWLVGGRRVHHIIDPRTGDCAEGPYATATVASTTCVRANAFATAALLWGEAAAYHLAQAGCSARLVRTDGAVEYVGGWPEDVPA